MRAPELYTDLQFDDDDDSNSSMSDYELPGEPFVQSNHTSKWDFTSKAAAKRLDESRYE